MKSICLSALVVALAAQVAAADDTMPWAANWDAAKKLAADSGKLIMVDVSTEWCYWCKKLDADTYADARVIKLSAQVVPLKVDAEKEGKDLAAKYFVWGYPTILFLDAQGEIYSRVIGYLPPEPFMAEVSKAIDAPKDFAQLEATLKEKPDDGVANVRMALVLVLRGRADEAAAAATRAEAAKFDGDELAKAYIGIGEIYRREKKLDEAIQFFTKADAAAKFPADRALAKVWAIVCYDAKGDVQTTRRLAEEVTALPAAPEGYLNRAKQFLGH
jgi:thioredoxin-related protein